MLFQVHVACQNFTLTGPPLCTKFLQVQIQETKLIWAIPKKQDPGDSVKGVYLKILTSSAPHHFLQGIKVMVPP